MVLKKPYAFIIKHFRLIHLLTTIPMFYLLIKTGTIAKFFSSYISSGYSIRFNNILSNLASNYISIFMYAAIILILTIFVVLSLILQDKNKPTKFYNYSIIYYIVLFILVTGCFNVFQMIEADTLNNTLARIIRDLIYLVYYTESFFIAFTFIRGTGFNLRKFDFKSDLAHLEISNKDSEEFEFLVGFDTYKTKRTVRRFFRELIYYYKENRFICNIVIVITVVILGTIIYMNRKVYDRIYNERESFTFGNMSIQVNNSYISNLSYNGKTIKQGKSYVILNIQIENKYRDDLEFNTANFKLSVGKSLIVPDISLGNYFLDYGNPYNGTLIKGVTKSSYILVYEINPNQVKNTYTLEAYSRFDSTPGGIGAINKRIKIKPANMTANVTTNNINFGSVVKFSNTALRDTEFSLSNYEIVNRFPYTYKYCPTKDVCQDAISTVSIPGSELGRYTLLVLDYSLKLAEDSSYMYSNKTFRNFFEDFMEIEYIVNGTKYTSKANLLNPNSYNEKLILKINDNISTASDIKAKITVRNIAYLIKIK